MSQKAALIVIDPLNDFIHPEGKLYGHLKESIEATDTVKNLIKLIQAARRLQMPIYYSLHQPYSKECFKGWNHMKESHRVIQFSKVFDLGSWGAEIYQGLEPDFKNGDVVVSRHWNSRYLIDTQFLNTLANLR